MARSAGYIHKFRVGVARELEEGRPEAEMAKDLGVSRKLLRDWRRLAALQRSPSAEFEYFPKLSV